MPMPEPGAILEYVATTLDIVERAQAGEREAIEYCLELFKSFIIASVQMTDDPEVIALIRRYAEEELKAEKEI